jgi:hypothetical protein
MTKHENSIQTATIASLKIALEPQLDEVQRRLHAALAEQDPGFHWLVCRCTGTVHGTFADREHARRFALGNGIVDYDIICRGKVVESVDIHEPRPLRGSWPPQATNPDKPNGRLSPEYYRVRAEEMRTKAESMVTVNARRLMFNAADSWDECAKWAERLSGRK